MTDREKQNKIGKQGVWVLRGLFVCSLFFSAEDQVQSFIRDKHTSTCPQLCPSHTDEFFY